MTQEQREEAQARRNQRRVLELRMIVDAGSRPDAPLALQHWAQIVCAMLAATPILRLIELAPRRQAAEDEELAR